MSANADSRGAGIVSAHMKDRHAPDSCLHAPEGKPLEKTTTTHRKILGSAWSSNSSGSLESDIEANNTSVNEHWK